MSGTTRKRKRITGMVQRFLFLHDAQDEEITCKRTSSLVKKCTPSIAKSWNQCGEGFQEVSPIEGSSRSMGEEQKVVCSLAPGLHSVEGAANTATRSSEETAEITWSSSDSDLSDGKVLMDNLRVLKERRPVLKGQSTVNSYHRYICLLNSLTDSQSSEEELPAIDWDSASDNEDTTSDNLECLLDPDFTDSDTSTCSEGHNRNCVTQQSESSMTAEDILEFSSDNETVKETELCTKPRPSLSVQPTVFTCESEHDKTSVRSASDWLKSAQAFLRTPEKQKRKQFKTPQDSAKKRKKFVRGGLAERLNRLQCRERSAINFWRHRSPTDSKIHAGGKADILMVKILELHEECSMFVALCQPLMKTSTDQAVENYECTSKIPLKVLFTRETTSYLGICAGDIVHIYPPWQKIDIQDEEIPVILCTYFSQKVHSKKIAVTKANYCCPGKPMVFRKAPMSLAVKFNLIGSRQKHHSADQQDTTTTAGNAENILLTPQEKEIKVLNLEHYFSANGICDSLLEVIESQGAAGWAKQNLKVVIQRVYCLPIKEALHNQLTRSNQPDHPLPSNVGQQNARLCFLVQDMYGLFSEVHHHTFCSLEEDLQVQSACWEGKTCYLTGMKVLQRTTRGRSSGLFSLIDSLWPPLIPPKVHGQSQGSQEHVPERHRCSFSAEVIYRRLQEQTANLQINKDFWLCVTDSTLQSASHDSGVPRTISVCVTSFCVLGTNVIKSLNDEASSNISFKNAVVEKDSIVCAEGTVLSVQKSMLQSNENQEISPLNGNFILDKLSAKTKLNSLCTVQGTVVGVDESTAFSWIVCNRCENGKLEKKHGEGESFYCRQCARSVMTPRTKKQLEVFLQYPVLPHSTVKIKLLEQSISSLLLHSSSDEGGYEMNSVLGQELGPLSCYVRSVTNQPASWIGLEEIRLLS
ncbi:DNA repair-scaffolding protein isoform X4 [Scyliorhinus canicula]|uniref:DNA repair-scaffolding protein isoform X4 n=1 Tax=Scyliorhinus canicula TaxID=7830 RepID=UPI0018F5DC43|nr:DNA repair-scaffolding protein isoform X4 [Scyliorhinus canicula]